MGVDTADSEHSDRTSAAWKNGRRSTRRPAWGMQGDLRCPHGYGGVHSSAVGDAEQKVKRVLTGASALAAAVSAHYNAEHDEFDRVTVLGVPLFLRDERGNPRVLGIPFRRWIRGPRRS